MIHKTFQAMIIYRLTTLLQVTILNMVPKLPIFSGYLWHISAIVPPYGLMTINRVRSQIRPVGYAARCTPCVSPIVFIWLCTRRQIIKWPFSCQV
ncbi:hypothetical protein Hanom_Chr08g00687691 [Helianthus anomalus]